MVINMARTADHDARRRQIADAVRGVLAAEGFEAATVARVAREAGVSVGLVQHYFASKDALLVHTHADALARLEHRADEIVTAGERAGDPIRVMATACLQLVLPLDRERRADHAVGVVMLARAGVGPEVRRAAAAHHDRLRARLALAVANGTRCGEVDPGTDVDAAAHELWALVLGLADQLYVAASAGPRSRAARRSLGVLDVAVGRVFAHPCRHHG